MKLGIVISTNEPEAAWNALRLANTALGEGHEVTVFLMNRGVEIGGISDVSYDVSGQAEMFTRNRGRMLACGTCVAQRDSANVCPVSTMKDLLAMVQESDRVLTFG